MSELLLVACISLFAVLFMAGVVWVGLKSNEQLFADMRTAGATFEDGTLDYIEGTMLVGPKLEGVIEGRRVEFSRSIPQRGGSSAAFHQARVHLQHAKSLELATQHGSGNLAKMLGGTDYIIGDPVFDPLVKVGGHELTSRAHLDAEARRAIVASLVYQMSVRDGVVIVETSSPPNADEVRLLLRHALTIARAVDHTPTMEKLATIATTDPLPMVRAEALRCFATERSDDAIPLARKVLAGESSTTALRQTHDRRLAAALLLAHEGTAEHVPLLRQAADAEQQDTLATLMGLAIARIQARIGDAATGGISMASTPHEGALTQAAARKKPQAT